MEDQELTKNDTHSPDSNPEIDLSVEPPEVLEQNLQDEAPESSDLKQVKNPARKGKGVKIAFNVAFWVVLAILIAFVIFVNTFQLCLVMGSSMNNTLHDSEFILMQRRGYDVNRGDIVTVYVNKKDDYPIIKRVVAIKGDRLVFMKDGNGGVELYLDKGKGFKKLNEPYIKEKMSLNVFYQLEQFAVGAYKISPECDIEDVLDEYIIEVKNGLFVLGDNRNDSYDSRHYGILPYKNVEGKMVTELKKGSFAEKFLKKLFNADGLALKRFKGV